jgi:YD repeat-containing protein
MAPEDRAPRGPYDGATEANTKPTFLTDPKSGGSVLGEGVEANVDDLTAYSGNLDQIQMNFSHMGLSMATTLEGMASDAFIGDSNIFEWSGFFYQLTMHTVTKYADFVRDITTGMLNVAMAAQTVANVYTETDATSAANLQAINFAFGDKNSAPAGIPKQFLKDLKTWNDLQRENPNAGAAEAIAASGDPANDTKTETKGDTTTTTVTLPGGGTVVTVTKAWSTSIPGGPSGQTVTVYYNGNVQTSTHTSTVGSTTTSTTTSSVYGEDGKRRDQVTSRSTETVTHTNTHTQTNRETTSYSYDSDGNKIDESTSQSSTSVGYERPSESMVMPSDDPAAKKQNELRPTP